jgi:hypothetical protein
MKYHSEIGKRKEASDMAEKNESKRPDSFGGATYRFSAEQALWCAVLMRGIADAMNNAPKRQMRKYRGQMKMLQTKGHTDKVRATDWIGSNCRGFREVCDMAGIDAERVRAAYMEGRIDKKSISSWAS